MAKIDVKFMKGNRQTAKAMGSKWDNSKSKKSASKKSSGSKKK